MEWIPNVPKNPLTNEEKEKFTRYICAVSLAEGETLRRILHMRHPVLQGAGIALRSLEGGIIDVSEHYWPEIPRREDPTNIDMCIQSLKFINCEMYYKDDELEILEKALSGAPLANRKEFFVECLRLRRRERNLWDDTPLAKIFTPQEEWHMIRAKAILQQLSIAIEKTVKTRKKPNPWWNPYKIFTEHDTDEDGCLNRDELIRMFEAMKLDFSSTDYYEVSKLIPKNKKGLYTKEDWAKTLNLRSNEEIENILVTKVYSQSSENTENQKWICQVCSYAHNPKWQVICQACQHDILGQPVVKLNENEWQCGKCSLKNNKRERFCNACWNARPSRFGFQ